MKKCSTRTSISEPGRINPPALTTDSPISLHINHPKSRNMPSPSHFCGAGTRKRTSLMREWARQQPARE